MPLEDDLAQIGDAQARRNFYLAMIEEIQAGGIPTEEEVDLLAIAFFHDDEVRDRFGSNWAGLDKNQFARTLSNLDTGLMTRFVAQGEIKTGFPVVGPIFGSGGITSRVLGSLASGAGKVVKPVAGFARKHPVVTGLGAIVATGFGLNAANQGDDGVPRVSDVQADPRFRDLTDQIAQSPVSPDDTSGLLQTLSASGINIDPNLLAALEFAEEEEPKFPLPNPTALGFYTVQQPSGLNLSGDQPPFTVRGMQPLTFPGINPRGLQQSIAAGQRISPGALPTPQVATGFEFGGELAPLPATMDTSGGQVTDTRIPGQIPQGAQISQGAFRKWGHQTLLQIAADAAKRHNVPLNLLYGIITAESNWNVYAEGDGGNSHGLAQIHLPAHPQVSANQARNPIFALDWAARNLKSNFNQLGSWEAAAISHRGGLSAGQHYTGQGTFKTRLDQQYLGLVLGYATASGLDVMTFDQLAAATAGVASAGPDVPPYLAPDPATLREFTRTAFTDLLGRDPTDAELEKASAHLNRGYRAAYNAQVSRLKGSSATDVDPEARLTETIRTSGEGKFRTRRDEYRSMSEWLGSVAGLMRNT